MFVATPLMTPPMWLDEHGERLPTRPCPKCGLSDPVLRLRYEHLRMNGWKPCKTFSMVNWCGHGQEFIPCYWGARAGAGRGSLGSAADRGRLGCNQIGRRLIAGKRFLRPPLSEMLPPGILASIETSPVRRFAELVSNLHTFAFMQVGGGVCMDCQPHEGSTTARQSAPLAVLTLLAVVGHLLSRITSWIGRTAHGGER